MTHSQPNYPVLSTVAHGIPMKETNRDLLHPKVDKKRADVYLEYRSTCFFLIETRAFVSISRSWNGTR